MRILAIDMGTGTQDILLFDSDAPVENSVKLVMPSATEIAARRMDTLNRLSGERPDTPWLLLTTINAALQRMPGPDYLRGTGFAADLRAARFKQSIS